MNYEKALSHYKNDKILQLLWAEHFLLLVSFFHLVFKQQDRISYLQTRYAKSPNFDSVIEPQNLEISNKRLQ
ncbi:hypothetical protein [Chryseobacterium sp. KCF3-3]|uniref:hypothetical protein n=1 Tax=Chryseobacterium sp. KCF3-3 TaxID=3231511 RepID=UPI0038B3C555